ncbi:MAG TPA: helix-turn-helix domain-containing protein [Gaiellaceae bacterium]|nr:helix-turn-helix domain-containing protein [Gaiellaceae bacterium]
MGIARDGLRNLLDVLVESVETGGNGEEIAARVHVSRFHFDRIVAAALEETPGAFRRRLLLERAAHALAGAASVGEAALVSGYRSPEAFARAFRRAYAVAPSAFAGSGLPFRLPAPNGIHFHPPGALLVAGSERSETMDLTDRLLEHDLWLTGRLLDAAEELPAEQLAEPLDVEGETLGSMLERLVWSKEMWNAAVEGRPMPERSEGSPECLRKRLAEAGPAFLEIVRGVRARGTWDTAFVDATCEPPESFTYGGMAAHVLTHSAHRRNVVLEALQRHGVVVEHSDPLGWERAERA